MNIYDVAARCKVSIATVSRVLNHHPSVSEKTRQRVLAVMEELNFTPNTMARGLGTGYTHTVGVVYTNPESPFLPSLGRIERALHAAGLTTLVHGAQPGELNWTLDELAQKGVDGILLLGTTTEEDTPGLSAAGKRAPLVAVGHTGPLPEGTCVYADLTRATAQVVATLFGRQRRNILLLHDGESDTYRQMVAGYRESYASAGYPTEDSRLIAVERDLNSVNACVKQLLVKGVSFDAVLATHDLLAIGAQKSLQRIGLNMPVIGCHNTPLARCATPEISSIDTAMSSQCDTAVEVFLRRLRGEEVPAQISLPATLMERDSFRQNG